MIIFAAGALGYGFFEVCYRGYTHWTMMLTGGACLLTFYYFDQEYKQAPPLLKAIGGALIITTFEFFVGLVVNVWFGWQVWDYTEEPGNILGIICPKFCLFWFIICFALTALSQKLNKPPT